MALGIHKRKWEKAMVLAVAGLIALGYAYTMIRLALAPLPEPAAEASPEVALEGEASPAEPAPVRSREMRQLFRRQLIIHEPDAFLPDASHRKEPDYDATVFVPEIGAKPASSLMQDSMTFQPSPVRGPSRPRDDLEEEQQEKDSTGWGWLADDIASGRRERDRNSTGGPDTGSRAGERERDATEGELDEEATGRSLSRPGSDDRREGSGSPRFIDSTYERTAREGDGTRPALREEQDRWVSRDVRDEPKNGLEAYTGADSEMLDPYESSASGESFGRGLVMRDPFVTPPENAGRQGDSPAWLSVPPNAEAVFGFRQPGEATALTVPSSPRALSIPSPASGFGGGSGMAAAGSTFAPMGGIGSRVDELFSGAPSFDNSSAFGSPVLSESPGRRAADIDRSSPGALPW